MLVEVVVGVGRFRQEQALETADEPKALRYPGSSTFLSSILFSGSASLFTLAAPGVVYTVVVTVADAGVVVNVEMLASGTTIVSTTVGRVAIVVVSVCVIVLGQG